MTKTDILHELEMAQKENFEKLCKLYDTHISPEEILAQAQSENHEDLVHELHETFIQKSEGVSDTSSNIRFTYIHKSSAENLSTRHNIYNYEIRIGNQRKPNAFLSGIVFLFKYSVTSAMIFAILMLGSNFSAYYNIARSYVMHEEMENTKKQILNTVQASHIEEKTEKQDIKESKSTNTEQNKNYLPQKRKIDKKQKFIDAYKTQLDNTNIDINVEITPFENRVVIPKLGKNIPLLDVKEQYIQLKEDEKAMEEIFMKELENGVVRYPGSSTPGKTGNTFIFGHSSNYFWEKGNYNDVFATLNNLDDGDEIIVYYEQKKYVYKVKKKHVVSPKDVSVLNSKNNKKEISVMTCWPIGTTTNRLIVTGELVENN